MNLSTEGTNRGKGLLLCEGLATGLSLLESTGLEVLVSFGWGNLKAVALSARQDWPDREIILAADNDCGGGPNVGLEKAREAALAINGLMAVPFLSSDNGAASVDFNDLHRLEGPEAVRAFINMAYEPVKGAGHAK